MIDLIKDNLANYIAYFIAISCLIQIYAIYFLQRNNIINDLRGKDTWWQLRELSAIIWLALFPTLAIISVFGISVGEQVWWSLDLCYFANLGSKNLDNFIHTKYGKQQGS